MVRANSNQRPTNSFRSQRNRIRIWRTRLHWLVAHAYGYIVLGVSNTLRNYFESERVLFGVYLFVVIGTFGLYIKMQMSSPGFAIKEIVTESSIQEAGMKNEHPKEQETLVASSSGRRWCKHCELYQPLRCKHCLDCGKCVLRYDHHCLCAGVCVGDRNRRLFYLFLVFHVMESAWNTVITLSAYSSASSIDAWFGKNIWYMILSMMLFSALSVQCPLLLFQTYLIATNRTHWEYARQSHITYLKSLPLHSPSPFHKSYFWNCFYFWRNNSSQLDVWRVHDPPARTDVPSSSLAQETKDEITEVTICFDQEAANNA